MVIFHQLKAVSRGSDTRLSEEKNEIINMRGLTFNKQENTRQESDFGSM